MEKRILVGGKWMTASETFEVRSPYSGELVATVYFADTDISSQSIGHASKAAEVMRGLARFEIASGLRKIASGIAARRDEFATTITLENAKPIIYARAEVDRALATFSWAASEAERFVGEIVPIDTQPAGRGKTARTERRPKGVIYGMTPFNFPLNLVAHKVAPALASGNAIIIKPSPRTPLTALLLGEVFLESGLPGAALQIVPLDIRHLQTVFDDERIAMVSFTGSADVGWEIKKRIGKKSLALELGGNAPVIVDRSANLETALPKLLTGAFAYSGQVCISVQRLYLHEELFDRWTRTLAEEAGKLEVGDPMAESTRLSVMIDEAAATRAENWINEAVSNGARLVCGGIRNGSFLPPTILTNTDPEMRVVAEEAFAPLLVIEKFDNVANAVASANDTRYGLQAGVFSYDQIALDSIIGDLDFGTVIVNDVPSFRIDNMPYGGVKDSGFGREGIRYAMEEMSELKLVISSQI